MLTTHSVAVPGFDLPLTSQARGRTKVARVVVPQLPPPSEGWPVCYLLHSFGGDRLSWPRSLGTALHRAPWMQTVLVSPESGRRWFIDDAGGYLYEDYVVSELVPAIDAVLPVRHDVLGRIIGGFSMGGAAAVTIALRHPQYFGSAFSYSGAFYANRRIGDPYRGFRTGACMMPTEEEHERVWGEVGSRTRALYDPDHLVAQAVERGSVPQLAIGVGIDDYARVLDLNRAMHRMLVLRGISHRYRESPGGHEWSAAIACGEWALSDWFQ